VEANVKNPKTSRRATPKQAAAGIENLRVFNATRSGMPAIKSGVNVVIRSRGAELPPVPGARKVARQADAIVRQMVSDLGYDSVEDVPAAKRAILESQRLNLLVLGLANQFLRSEGILNPRNRKPHSILSIIVSFSNSLRHNGLALGLERKPRRAGPTDLASYLSLRDVEVVAPDPRGDAAAPDGEPTEVRP
jgi:hypothetical protein